MFHHNEYLDHCPQMFVPNFHNTSSSSCSSSSPLSCYGFFHSDQDQSQFHHPEMQNPTNQPEVIVQSQENGTHDLEKRDDQGLKFSLWKNGDQTEVKWMSSKMRVMQKMKNSAHGNNSTCAKFGDHKQQQQQEAFSSAADHNANPYKNNPPVRVCSDCNTTKTPLWRSGPNGPKSLCNACGIRQRKARRAMAAAAAAAAENGKNIATETPALKMKVQNKDFKKKCKPTSFAGTSNNGAQKKSGLEDFLFNLSKNLAYHRVFPQEEKDAAILLMALSCSRLHV